MLSSVVCGLPSCVTLLGSVGLWLPLWLLLSALLLFFYFDDCFFMYLFFCGQVLSLADARPIRHAPHGHPTPCHRALFGQARARALRQRHVRVSATLEWKTHLFFNMENRVSVMLNKDHLLFSIWGPARIPLNVVSISIELTNSKLNLYLVIVFFFSLP